MDKKVIIMAPVSAIKGDCKCPLGWLEELFNKEYDVVIRVTSGECVIEEISNEEDLKKFVKTVI